MKALICGGRDFNDAAGLFSTLDTIQRWTLQEAENTLGIAFGVLWETTGPITCVVTGAARGTDLHAENWAKSREVAYHGHPSPWHTHDPRWCKCSGAMVALCRAAGIEVYEPFRKAPTKGAQPLKMALDRPG